MTDHDPIVEQLELAAVEPGGLDRLMAGDTPAAQAVAAHLVGCPSCSDELVRLEHSASLIRDVIQLEPPAELRARTLAAVASTGIPRGRTSAATGVPTGADPGGPAPSAPTPLPVGTERSRRRPAIAGWIAGIAAAVVLSVVTTTFVVGNRVDEQLAAQAETVSALEEVTTATLKINAAPDERHAALTGTTDATLTGSLAFSPGTTDFVIVATGLTEPAAGKEYRCWIEIDGVRHKIGKMFFSPDLAYWVGPAAAVSGLTGPAMVGVSLVNVADPGVTADPTLLGSL